MAVANGDKLAERSINVMFSTQDVEVCSDLDSNIHVTCFEDSGTKYMLWFFGCQQQQKLFAITTIAALAHATYLSFFNFKFHDSLKTIFARNYFKNWSWALFCDNHGGLRGWKGTKGINPISKLCHELHGRIDCWLVECRHYIRNKVGISGPN